LRRPRPQEIQEATDGREEAPGQRPAAAPEAHALEEHVPEDRLLERDRLEPPRRDRAQPAPTGGEAAEKRPHPHVNEDLERVEEINRDRRAVALQRPRPAREPGPLAEGELLPHERVVGRRGRFQEAHGTLLAFPTRLLPRRIAGCRQLAETTRPA